MSKTSLCLVSLIAAIPGAGLAGLMVISFLNYADKSPGALKALAGVSLLLGGALALMPVAILVFAGPKAPKKPKAAEGEPKDAASESQAVAAASDSVAESEEPGDGDTLAQSGDEDDFTTDATLGFDDDAEMHSGEVSEDLEIAEESPSEEFSSATEDALEIGSDEFDTPDVAATQEFDFSIEDDEEPPPKTKKK